MNLICSSQQFSSGFRIWKTTTAQPAFATSCISSLSLSSAYSVEDPFQPMQGVGTIFWNKPKVTESSESGGH
ncbi:hypothetical protein E2C01_031539 [Portunus trituberculatus]|uniref:Uncharacterized protein n=1 Tax=Portunus trituberculatus TaxID=210409 RepID=A0A5B7EYE2_PORTR|nr:hypothetical protein [Portunus trituberculatus]